MELFEAILTRKTTNTAFANKAVSLEDMRMLVRMASRSPSHFNSQPWRFILVNDKQTINAIAKIAGNSMLELMENGSFWKRYRKYFRFSEKEISEKKDGIYIDHMPKILKPAAKHIFSESGGKIINKLKVPRILASDEEKLVASSPLLFAIILDKEEYKPQELSGMYSLLSAGAVIQTLWLTTNALGMGMQFISTPGEIPQKWKEVIDILQIPETHELTAIFRMGYVDKSIERPKIDWTSSQRKNTAELAFKNIWNNTDGLTE